MFSKLKQFKDLRNQAKTMQSALAEEKIELDKNGIKMVMNGNMEILELSINSDLKPNDIAKYCKDLFNEGIKKTQRVMAKKMQAMGGIPGLN
ncbi:MAG: YbaB/EbfC family nucleoid-associated protein [Patescibacteria group bacterium]|jgi:DNA-binding protein YbaB|nr:YbaB/EbfC family nucleoid-associated protein [Patescibacteria group bacterium]